MWDKIKGFFRTKAFAAIVGAAIAAAATYAGVPKPVADAAGKVVTEAIDKD